MKLVTCFLLKSTSTPEKLKSIIWNALNFIKFLKGSIMAKVISLTLVKLLFGTLCLKLRFLKALVFLPKIVYIGLSKKTCCDFKIKACFNFWVDLSLEISS